MAVRVLPALVLTGPLLEPVKNTLPNPSVAGVVVPVILAAVAAALVATAVRTPRLGSRPPGAARARIAASVLLCALPWLLPDTWFLPSGRSLGTVSVVKFAAATAFGLAAAAAVLVPRLALPGAVTACLALTAWPFVRPTVVGFEVDASLSSLGRPPRSLLLMADLNGSRPGLYAYADGRVSLGFLDPGGSWNDGPIAYVSARPASGTPCALLAPGGEGGTDCRSLGNGIWHVTGAGNSIFGRIDGDLLVEAENDGSDVTDEQLLALLADAHPASSTDIVLHT